MARAEIRRELEGVVVRETEVAAIRNGLVVGEKAKGEARSERVVGVVKMAEEKVVGERHSDKSGLVAAEREVGEKVAVERDSGKPVLVAVEKVAVERCNCRLGMAAAVTMVVVLYRAEVVVAAVRCKEGAGVVNWAVEVENTMAEAVAMHSNKLVAEGSGVAAEVNWEVVAVSSEVEEGTGLEEVENQSAAGENTLEEEGSKREEEASSAGAEEIGHSKLAPVAEKDTLAEAAKDTLGEAGKEVAAKDT